MDHLPQKVSVIGQGKLGCPIAAALATRGFDVVGVDTDAKKVDAINRGQAPLFEPGLTDLLQNAKPHLRATTDLVAAILSTDASLIIVPTPSGSDGKFSLHLIQPVLETIGPALAQKGRYHLVVITSTVMPGDTANVIQPALEKASGLRCGSNFGLCYSPEFVALGSVIHDFLNPDMILIGQSDPKAGDWLESICLRAALTKPQVARMNFVNAELTKIAVNTFVTTKITYANMLTGMCQKLPGAHIDVVTSALGLDSRIGRKYLKGGAAYGGPCFPRDNVALAALAQSLGAPADLAQTVDRSNRQLSRQLADLAKSHLESGKTVGILGLSYKPETDVVEQAQGLLLAKELASDGVDVLAYDPAAMPPAQAILGQTVRMAPSLAACVASSDVLILVTPWKEFRQVETMLHALGQNRRPRVVIDCWRYFDRAKIESAARYIALGVA